MLFYKPPEHISDESLIPLLSEDLPQPLFQFWFESEVVLFREG
jgi:hypothetical protein